MSNPPHEDRTRYAPSSNDKQQTGSKTPGDFAAGEVIAGSYKVLSFIGRGGMGAVYRVKHLFLDKEMALKTLSGDQITEVAWKRFQIEGQAIARLDHQNIIRIYDLGIVNEKQPYYTMELVEGITLGQMLHEQGALQQTYALPIFRQVAAALAYSHERNIVHRDLKPANIMLLPNPKSDIPVAKVLDFGLAKLTDLSGAGATGLTKTGEIFGSPLYMSPEQGRGLAVGPATDIYSFGCSLFEALTGEVPFKGSNAVETMMMHQSKVAPRLSDVRPDLHFGRELEDLVAKMLAKNAQDRYKSFADIAHQILLIERPQESLSQPRQERTFENAPSNECSVQSESGLSSNPWFWPAVSAGAVLLLVVISAFSYHAMTPKPKRSFSTVQVLKPTPPNTAPVSQNVETYFSHEEIIDGKKVKIFDFPPDSSLGYLNYNMDQTQLALAAAEWKRVHGDLDHNPFSQGIPAKGKQIVSTEHGLEFTPEDRVCNTPWVFKLFRADDLIKLDLSGNEYVDADFMPFIKHLKGLQELYLSDTSVDDKCLKVIDSLPNLGFLRIDHTRITGAALARSKVINRLGRLSFSNGKDISPLLAALQGNTKIFELRLDDCTLTSDDIEKLSSLPELTKLDANDAGVGDEGLKILAKSRSLKKLVIEDTKITPASIPTLTRMNLEKLTLSAKNWTPQDQTNLKIALARKHRYCNITFKSVGL